MGFASYNDIIAALSNGKGQAYFFYKTGPSTPAAGLLYRLWNGVGFPVAGSDPTPALSGIVPTKATPGAFPIANPTAPATLHLLSFGAVGNYQATLFLYDRLWHAGGINLNTASQQIITDAAGPTRHSDGIGNQLLLEITTAAGSTARDVNVSYTNEADVSGRTATVNLPGSAAVNRGFFLSLQAGDRGVKSIQSVTMSGTMGGGVANLVMFNAMQMIALPFLIYVYSEKDLVLQSANLPQVNDDACLCLLYQSGGTSTPTFWGKIIMAEN